MKKEKGVPPSQGKGGKGILLVASSVKAGFFAKG